MVSLTIEFAHRADLTLHCQSKDSDPILATYALRQLRRALLVPVSIQGGMCYSSRAYSLYRAVGRMSGP